MLGMFATLMQNLPLVRTSRTGSISDVNGTSTPEYFASPKSNRLPNGILNAGWNVHD